MRLAEGEELAGRYRLVRRLGSGGMADVWLAEDSLLGRRVALKFLHERFGLDQEFVERFKREATAAAGLSHPNIVGIYDRGVVDERQYISMEYVEGAALKELVAGGLGIDEAIEITRQVLAGAGYAHEHGIIHRDLKPQNVLVDPEGRVRVADFGIARAGSSEITQTGSVLGTAQYLSPEQAQGFEITAAADVYSIGIMLFEQLTGDVPFDGETPVAVVLKQISDRPPKPSKLNPDVPPWLDAVVMKALAKNPEERFASAAEFSRALEARTMPSDATALYGALPAAAAGGVAAGALTAGETDGEPVDPDASERLTRPFWTRRRIIAAIVVALLLLGGGLAYALTRSGEATVPNVVGDLQAEAESRVERAGFETVIEQQEVCAEEGSVFEQSPTAGTEAEEGSRVTLLVSVGADARVPDLAGQSLENARRTLRNRDFASTSSKQRSARVDEGDVIETVPPAGEQVDCRTRIELVVSTGVATVDVPGVVGFDQDRAESALERRGLVADIDVEDSDEPEGTVLEQSPGAGESIRRGDTVSLTVSSGVGTVEVPDVIGQPEATAISILEGRGATNVRVVRQSSDDPSEDGRVTDQAPAAGSRIRSGETVTIFVASYEAPPEPEEPTTTTTDDTTTRPPPTTTPEPEEAP